MKSPVKSFLNTLLVAVCLMSLAATGQQEDPLRAHPVLHRDGVFTIRAVDRPYDLYRPRPVTTLAIEHRDWPGNWFCLWLPETVYEEGRNVWSNFTGSERTQRWSTETNGTLTWRMLIGRFELTSTLAPDAENNALWISHEFRNTSSEPLRLLSTQSCFHLVDAPQFISAFGERIWAKLDGEWMTTDRVDRLASPDPRRVSFCRHGLRPARVVKPFQDFPSAELLEEAHHPLIIAEAFGGKGAVGIGQRDYHHLFNNNDPILRCIHSEPKPTAALEPGAQAVQEGLIVFDRGDHAALVKRWERLARKRWGTAGEEARGPLRAHPTNPRYFTDGTQNPDGSLRAIYLTGSHTWNNRLDIGRDDPPKAFDFDAYLDFLERHGHNFIRLWAWDSALWDTHSALEWVEEGAIYHVVPQPWMRTGPGQALDGKPKFNLEQLDPAYFERLRSRVQAAGRHGIYVSVMLFEGWALSFDATSWRGHPFRLENNVQGINGDPNGDGKGLEIQTLTIPRITAAQEAYVRKVIDAVNDLDNVLYEISNEARLLNPASSTKDWQYHLIRFIKNEEALRPKQHPVGMTSQGGGGGDDSEILRNSPADWISPNPDKFDYQNNPPASDGKKVILLDTDHLWGVGGDAAWVWKSFLRGHNPLFMDPYAHDILGKGRPDQWEGARQALGATRGLARRIDLARMTPSLDLASTRYCLAKPGQEYLVYQPGTGEFSVNLGAANYAFEWFNPTTRAVVSSGFVKASGGNQTFTPPFSGPAVLCLRLIKQ